ncbi:MAG: hypothetical protein ACLTYN_10315 [Dysosmobacter welbionis]
MKSSSRRKRLYRRSLPCVRIRDGVHPPRLPPDEIERIASYLLEEAPAPSSSAITILG